ncbi:hypothetical protein GDO81_003718 [Engystomops pustulosus]|uniref:Uncharacterized protein n=1 Tax=Engystomops pustulosus TaxID=76066 RepID=A0AAV7A376_ENGPU|nr:hypothetical protein GDO81_003718 [Engystomops pustulosus]
MFAWCGQCTGHSASPFTPAWCEEENNFNYWCFASVILRELLCHASVIQAMLKAPPRVYFVGYYFVQGAQFKTVFGNYTASPV